MINLGRDLYEACMKNNFAYVRDSLTSGADPNGYRAATYRGFYPLHLAALHKNKDIAEALVEYRASGDVVDFLGELPLHVVVAGTFTCTEVLSLL